MPEGDVAPKNAGMRPASLLSNHLPWITHSLSPSTQGTLLKVVLDDYMHLKKLFAQRMVHKATASQRDRSSVSEVEGCAWAWGDACRALWDAVCLPGPTGCGHSLWPWSLSPSGPPTLCLVKMSQMLVFHWFPLLFFHWFSRLLMPHSDSPCFL